jgi:hypothetical protein
MARFEFGLEYWKRWQRASGLDSAQSRRSAAVADEVNEDEEEEPSAAPGPRRRRRRAARRGAAGGATRGTTKVFAFGSEPRFGEMAPQLCASELQEAGGARLAPRWRAPLSVPGGAIGLASRAGAAGGLPGGGLPGGGGGSSSSSSNNAPGPGEHPGAAASAFGAQASSVRRSAPVAVFEHGRRPPLYDSSQAGGPSAYGDGSQDASVRAAPEAHRFGGAARLAAAAASLEAAAAAAPGPGRYDVRVSQSSRSSTKLGPPPGSSSFARLQEERALHNTLVLRPVLQSCGYGHRCSRHQHLLFGQCVNGECSERATWETRRRGPGTAPLGHLAVLSLRGEPKADAEALAVLQQVELGGADERGRTVLHALAAAEFEPAARQLHKLELVLAAARRSGQALPLDARDADGNTALHLAALTEQVELVEALLRAGCSPEVENVAGDSPLQVAQRLTGKHKIYQALRAKVMLNDLAAELSEVQRTHRVVTARMLASRGQSQQQGLGSRAASPHSQGRPRSPTPFGGLPSRDGETRGGGGARAGAGGAPEQLDGANTLQLGSRVPRPLGGLPSRGGAASRGSDAASDCGSARD